MPLMRSHTDGFGRLTHGYRAPMSEATQTHDESNRSILDALDARVPTSFYWSLTLLATLGGFLFGYDTSNIGSVLDFVPYDLSGFWTGYLVAGASLGAAVGALAAGPLIIEIFPTLESGIGLGWVMVMFAVLSVVAIAFVA